MTLLAALAFPEQPFAPERRQASVPELPLYAEVSSNYDRGNGIDSRAGDDR